MAELELRRRASAERMATWKADFIAFAAQLDIYDVNINRVKLRPNAIQSGFEVSRTGRDIVLKPRQVGLTIWELARDVWFFLTRPGARVVVVVQSQTEGDVLRETCERIRIMFDALAEVGVALDFRSESVGHWVLGDASLKVITAGASEKSAAKKGRGGTIHRLHITELAIFECAKTTLAGMLQCVPGPETGSEIVIESTANGAAGMFYERWLSAKKGDDGYTPHFFRWTQDPKRQAALDPGEAVVAETDRERALFDKYGATPEQVKWYRRTVADNGQDLTDQEFPIDEETCWLVAGRMFFDRVAIVALRGKTSAPIATELGGALRIWRRAECGRGYVVSVDPSEGMGGDPGAAVVYDRASGEVVAALHGQFPTVRLAFVAYDIGVTYNTALLAIERNNHGTSVLSHLANPPAPIDGTPARKPYPNIFNDRDGKPGWNNTLASRPAALDALEDAIRTGRWATPDVATIEEMLVFVVGSNGKAEAARGAHDDLVMASAIGLDVIRKPQGYTGKLPRTRRQDFDDTPIG